MPLSSAMKVHIARRGRKKAASMGVMDIWDSVTGGRGKDKIGRSLTGGGRVRDTAENRALTEKHGAAVVGGIGEKSKAWDESKHPRGFGGKFNSHGKRRGAKMGIIDTIDRANKRYNPVNILHPDNLYAQPFRAVGRAIYDPGSGKVKRGSGKQRRDSSGRFADLTRVSMSRQQRYHMMSAVSMSMVAMAGPGSGEVKVQLVLNQGQAKKLARDLRQFHYPIVEVPIGSGGRVHLIVGTPDEEAARFVKQWAAQYHGVPVPPGFKPEHIKPKVVTKGEPGQRAMPQWARPHEWRTNFATPEAADKFLYLVKNARHGEGVDPSLFQRIGTAVIYNEALPGDVRKSLNKIATAMKAQARGASLSMASRKQRYMALMSQQNQKVTPPHPSVVAPGRPTREGQDMRVKKPKLMNR